MARLASSVKYKICGTPPCPPTRVFMGVGGHKKKNGGHAITVKALIKAPL